MASARVCLQWSMIIFNTFSVIIGILGIVACLFEMEKYHTDSKELREQYVQLGTASAILISAFIGCFGAVHGSYKVLGVFITVLVAIIVSHIWKLLRYNEDTYVKSTKSMVEYQWLEELVKRGAMDEMQHTYECCGKSSYLDYHNSKVPVPWSCFLEKNGLRSVNPYREGCERAVTRAFLQIYRYEKWAHCCLIAFEILGIILSVVLILKLTLKPTKYVY